MAGPTWAELWPSLDPSSRSIPQFTEGPVWNALMDLKSQLDSLLNNIGSNERNDVSIDSSKGRVFISDSAMIGPSYTLVETGSILQASSSLSSSLVMKNAKQSITENINNNTCPVVHSSELSEIFFETLEHMDCFNDPMSIYR